jgi:hypothetical protein
MSSAVRNLRQRVLVSTAGASVFTCQLSKTKGEKYAVKQAADAMDSLQSYPDLVRQESASY